MWLDRVGLRLKKKINKKRKLQKAQAQVQFKLRWQGVRFYFGDNNKSQLHLLDKQLDEKLKRPIVCDIVF